MLATILKTEAELIADINEANADPANREYVVDSIAVLIDQAFIGADLTDDELSDYASFVAETMTDAADVIDRARAEIG